LKERSSIEERGFSKGEDTTLGRGHNLKKGVVGMEESRWVLEEKKAAVRDRALL